jgi:hypothetical protein
MRGFLIFLLAVIAGVCGCLGSKSTNTPNVIPVDRAGTFQSSDSSVAITVPSGALSSQQQPSVNIDSQAPGFSDTVNIRPFGSAYMLTPVNAEFQKSITLAFKYSTASLPAGISPDMLRIYFFKDSSWQLMSDEPPVLDTANQTISINLNNFKYPMVRLGGDIRINKLKVESFAITDAQKAVVTFNKKLDPLSAVISSNYFIKVDSNNFAVSSAVYSAGSYQVTLVMADISAREGKKAVLTVSTSLKDEYNQNYDPLSQTIASALESAVDLVLDSPGSLVPQPDSDPAAPGQPVIVRSNEGVTALSWEESTYLNSTANIVYTLETADDAAFSANRLVYTTSNTSVNVALLEGSAVFDWYNKWSWTVASPVLQTYYWRVKADYKKGYADEKNSVWSQVSNLRYDRPNQAPSTPANPKVNSIVSDSSKTATPAGAVSWDISVDPEGLAVSYEVVFNSAADFQAANTASLTGISASSVLLNLVQADLADDTVYYWRVRSLDPRGGFSGWSDVSSFFFNKVNNVPVISNMYPTGGQGIPHSASGEFRADVTNTDRDTYSYSIHIYTDAAGSVSAGSKTNVSSLPVAMTDISWEAGHPVEDLQQYYWKLTVTEASPSYPPANAPVVSPLQNFVKSDGDTKPVVTLNAPATPLSGAHHQIGEETALTWSVTDSDSSAALISYELAVFSADNDQALVVSKNLGQNILTGTINDVSTSHNLVSGTLYYWGVRANDNADFLNDPSRTSPYGDWTRHSFIYKAGPVITNVTVSNVTDQVFTVLWRTDSEDSCVNNFVYYTTDGSVPSVLSSSSPDLSAFSKVHYASINLGGSSPLTNVRFYVSSESSVIPGIRTNDTNNGSYYTVQAGKAYSGAPPSPSSLILKYTGAAENSIYTCRIKHERTLMGTTVTLVTYFFQGVITSEKSEINQLMNRWQTNEIDGSGSVIDSSAYTEMKVYDITVHTDSGASVITGEYSITQEAEAFPEAVIPVN